MDYLFKEAVERYHIYQIIDFVCLMCPDIKREQLIDENQKLTIAGTIVTIFTLIALIQKYSKIMLKEQPNEQQTNSDSINNHSSNSSNNSDDGPKDQ